MFRNGAQLVKPKLPDFKFSRKTGTEFLMFFNFIFGPFLTCMQLLVEMERIVIVCHHHLAS